ncbi:MAG: hypothetical protein AAGD38_11775 [Acidobacteriota bacterium]
MKKLLLLAIVLSLAGSPIVANMPSTLGQWAIEGETYPFWVRADLVLHTAGEVDGTFIVPYVRELLKDHAARVSRGECIDENDVWVDHTIGSQVSWSKLQEAIDVTQHILVGTVVDKTPGLIGRSLGTLVKIEEFRFLKKNPRLDIGHDYYLHINTARFDMDGKTYCTHDRRHPELPEVGERVLVFPTHLLEGDIMTVEGIVIERKSGEIEASSTFSDLPPNRTLDQLIALVESSIGSNPR